MVMLCLSNLSFLLSLCLSSFLGRWHSLCVSITCIHAFLHYHRIPSSVIHFTKRGYECRCILLRPRGTERWNRPLFYLCDSARCGRVALPVYASSDC